jgi:hypothetical protein
MAKVYVGVEVLDLTDQRATEIVDTIRFAAGASNKVGIDENSYLSYARGKIHELNPGDEPYLELEFTPTKALPLGATFGVWLGGDFSGAGWLNNPDSRYATVTIGPATTPVASPTVIRPRVTGQKPARGKLLLDLDLSQFTANDSGKDASGQGIAQDRFWYGGTAGRTQPNNQEPVFYANHQINPGTNPWAVEDDGGKPALVLRTGQFAQTFLNPADRRLYDYWACVLNWFNHPLLGNIDEGVVDVEASLPSIPGSWPAIWFMPRSGWPPESDLMEQFYGTWGDPKEQARQAKRFVGTEHWQPNNQTCGAIVDNVTVQNVYNTYTADFRKQRIRKFLNEGMFYEGYNRFDHYGPNKKLLILDNTLMANSKPDYTTLSPTITNTFKIKAIRLYEPL